MTKNNLKEGEITKGIEKETAKVPSGVYLAAGLAAMGTSIILKCAGHKHAALLIGQWASPFLIMGLYDKNCKNRRA
ncbi:MAG: hypothetical protein LBG19_06715 [Prevotellaceae bacterium]|jgi:hypothetical protein|nr:hypothetical protein [Prevotellaceae bacterium]